MYFLAKFYIFIFYFIFTFINIYKNLLSDYFPFLDYYKILRIILVLYSRSLLFTCFIYGSMYILNSKFLIYPSPTHFVKGRNLEK